MATTACARIPSLSQNNLFSLRVGDVSAHRRFVCLPVRSMVTLIQVRIYARRLGVGRLRTSNNFLVASSLNHCRGRVVNISALSTQPCGTPRPRRVHYRSLLP